MKIFELKRMADYCGFVSLIQHVEVRSAAGRKLLQNTDFCVDPSTISLEHTNTQRVISLLGDDANKKSINTLYQLFSDTKDIENTLLGLHNSKIMNDIELFEIKLFAFNAKKILEIILQLLDNKLFDCNCEIDFAISDFDEVIKILDPENTCVPTFYIYSAYSKTLQSLREQELQKKNDHELSVIQVRIFEIEQQIREELSRRLKQYSAKFLNALKTVAYIDLLFAKAEFALEFDMCKPEISIDTTDYKAIFNPEVKQSLEKSGRCYQCIDIVFGHFPTLITGINMGGKTLMLKTLAISQLLFQYGFYVPATEANIAIVDDVMYSFTDEQDHVQGLSSFASEMKRIDEIISTIDTNPRVLVLIDELARTTNPKEGAAIVSAMLDILQEREVSSFITTHYDIETSCRRLRVKGLKDEVMAGNNLNITYIQKAIDYNLIDDVSQGTPNEAIRIAEMLGINKRLIERAKSLI
jgi:mutS family protein